MEIPTIPGQNAQPGHPIARIVLPVVAIALVGMGILAAVMAFAIPAALNPLFKSWFDVDLDPTVVPPGDLRAFDPIATFAAVRAYAGDGARPVSMRATYVRPDGTLDLNADLTPSPNVSYEFVREIRPGPDAPPIGAGVNASGTQWQTIVVTVGSPGKTVYVRRLGGKVNAQYYYTNKGMQKDERQPRGSNDETVVPDPSCPFADLWKKAIERGAPAQAVAVISYDDDGYDFRINDTDVRLTFGKDCDVLSKR